MPEPGEMFWVLKAMRWRPSVPNADILRRVGVILFLDAAAFSVVMAYVALGGMFADRERLYMPILIAFFIPLIAGFVLAAYQLQFIQKDAAIKAKWWPRFLWSGPFASGWSCRT